MSPDHEHGSHSPDVHSHHSSSDDHPHQAHSHSGVKKPSHAAHFDSVAATWDDDPAKIERARLAAELLKSRLPLKSSDRVLDFGGGTGQLSLHLAEAISSATIADASSGMVQAAAGNIERAGLGDRFDARVFDPMDPEQQLPAAAYDGVYSQLVLHHVDDIDLLLQQLYAALKPGGWIAIIDLDLDPNGAFHRANPDFDGHHGFSRDSFAAQLRSAGFSGIELSDGGQVDKELNNQVQPFPLFLATARK